MFNFTTLTIFNKVVPTTEKDIRDKKAPKGYNLITRTTANGPEIRIGNTRFNAANVIDILVKNHTVENLAKVTFDIAKLIATVIKDGKDVQEGSYRILLYIGLSMNSQDSFYANDLVYKGKPLFIEFPINAGDEPSDVATRIVKIANKYLLFQTLEKLLDVTNDEGKVIFEGVNGYLQIRKAIIQKYDPNANQIDCCNNNGGFVDIITGVPVMWETDEDGVVTVGEKTLESDGARELTDTEVAIEPGLEAFGDYNWIIHNLRLPTLANTYFWAANKSEMPIVGGEYTQFIIRMCVDRDGIAGGVVGQRATSVTTHVLYVLDQGNNVATIKSKLAALKQSKTDADTALQDPFKEFND